MILPLLRRTAIEFFVVYTSSAPYALMFFRGLPCFDVDLTDIESCRGVVDMFLDLLIVLSPCLSDIFTLRFYTAAFERGRDGEFC